MIETRNLKAGYAKKIVIDGVNIEVKGGEIAVIIGPNGSGKSTLLKTLTGQLKKLGGCVFIDGKESSLISPKEKSKKIAMVTTERIHPECFTCRDVVATGRYPYTGQLGILRDEDKKAVDEALKTVRAEEIAGQDFNCISDGQKQRIMLARAICQDTPVIILDEPTSYLDMFYKLDLLKTIKLLAKKYNRAIIMSLHELDLVKMIADSIICLKECRIIRTGKSSEIFTGNFIQKLYGVNEGEFDPESATMKLAFSNLCSNQRTSEIIGQTERKKHHAKVIMVQGTMSDAGKSIITAGLCRVFHQDGYRVAPFKSQNMALNSFITKEGLEMGRAQVMQAEAAGIEPMVCMNPILLKPVSTEGSQVIVNGEVKGNMKARDYFAYKKNLVPDIIAAFEKLEESADIIVIEGAGSPAEINLKQNDIVNMGLAEMLDANVLLVSDIDRGGVFAQLYGTVSLLEENERNRIKGLVINKFRGDVSILEPGIRMIEEKCRIDVTGVIPYMNLHLDDEDSLSPRLEKKEQAMINIGIVHLPFISNFTDFNAFEKIDCVAVNYITDPLEIERMDMIIIPGSKNTIHDLIWMRQSGIEAAVKKFSQKGIVIGICGGYQMLGKSIKDPDSMEDGGTVRGMEMLDAETVMMKDKTRLQSGGTFEDIEGDLSCLNKRKYSGYEIHMGKTSVSKSMKPFASGCFNGNVYGSYIHGLFDGDDIAETITEGLASKKGIDLKIKRTDFRSFKEAEYDKLAECIRNNMDMKKIYGMLKEADIKEE